MRFLWICLGGAAGTGARYLVATTLARLLGSGFPWGTHAVHVLGSLLLGAIMQLGLNTQLLSPELLTQGFAALWNPWRATVFKFSAPGGA